MAIDKLIPTSSVALTGVDTMSDQTSPLHHGVTKATQFTTAIRTGTTPKIGISKEGSMMLAIPKTPVSETVVNTNKSDDLKKQAVLEEESYLDKMEEIIERDFFPGIQEMQKRIDAIDYLLKHGEQPMFSMIENNAEPKQSLSEFLSMNTTEDNHSFAELIKKDNNKIRDRYPWLWADKSGKYANGRIFKTISITNNATGIQRPLELVARMTPQIDYENRLRALQLGWTDERATNVKGWQNINGPCNNLMFFKDGHGKGLSTKQLKTQASKVIQHSQTRFNPAATPKMSHTEIPKNHILDSILRGKNDNLSKLPTVNGYGFVTGVAGRQPRPIPPPQAALTSSTRSFSISEPSKRESLHERLLNRKLQTRKQEKINPFGNSTPASSVTSRITKSTRSSTSGRLTRDAKSNKTVMLSPAGSHLLSTLNRKRASNTFKPSLVDKSFLATTPNLSFPKKR